MEETSDEFSIASTTLSVDARGRLLAIVLALCWDALLKGTFDIFFAWIIYVDGDY